MACRRRSASMRWPSARIRESNDSTDPCASGATPHHFPSVSGRVCQVASSAVPPERGLLAALTIAITSPTVSTSSKARPSPEKLTPR